MTPPTARAPWVLGVRNPMGPTGENPVTPPFSAVIPVVHTPYYCYDLLNR